MNISNKKVFINFRYFLVLPVICCLYLIIAYNNLTDDNKSKNYNVEENDYLQTSYILDDENGYKDSINIIDTKPISDIEAINIEEYKFSVKNIYDEAIDYYIRIINNDEMIEFDKCEKKLIDNTYLRYKLDNNVNQFLMDTNNEILYKGHLEKGSSNIHSLKIWVTNLVDGDSFNKHFHGKIQIYRLNR